MNNTQIMKLLEEKFINTVAHLHMQKHYTLEQISKITGENMKARELKAIKIYFPLDDDDVKKLWDGFRKASAVNFLDTVEKAFTRFACEALSPENMDKYLKKHGIK